jgi:hypothetical protein
VWRRIDLQYALLIYDEESARGDVSPEDSASAMKEYDAYSDWLQEKGWIKGGEALHDTTRATTVRGTTTTDGPFAETKEQLGGFYLIECENLDQALEAARRCPGSRYGAVEVRPVIDFSQGEMPG